MLMVSGVFAAACVSFPTQYACVHALDVSVWLPKPSVTSECDVALPAGRLAILSHLGAF